MSIIEIAKVASVSKSTVSRVLNGEDNVSPAAAAAVKNAMLQLNYQEPAKKRGPKTENRKNVRKSGQFKNILFLIGDRPEQEFQEMSHLSTIPRILFGIERIIYKYGLNLILVGKSHLKRFPQLIKQTQPVGAFWFPKNLHPDSIIEWIEANPNVQLLRPAEKAGDLIKYNNSRVGEIAAEYFIKRGHRHAAFFNLDPDHEPALERGKTFIENFKAAGGKITELSTATASTTDIARVRDTENLISKMLEADNIPTAIFGAGDAITCLVHPVLREHGIEPMKDIDIISCDNTEYYMNQMTPRPATIDIGFEVLGERALEMLTWRIRNPGCRQTVTQVIEPILIKPQT
jgi:LacI family transcriptional regulator